jgi:hypothetical protein
MARHISGRSVVRGRVDIGRRRGLPAAVGAPADALLEAIDAGGQGLLPGGEVVGDVVDDAFQPDGLLDGLDDRAEDRDEPQVRAPQLDDHGDEKSRDDEDGDEDEDDRDDMFGLHASSYRILSIAAM